MKETAEQYELRKREKDLSNRLNNYSDRNKALDKQMMGKRNLIHALQAELDVLQDQHNRNLDKYLDTHEQRKHCKLKLEIASRRR